VAIPASEVMKKKIIQNEMSKTFFIFYLNTKSKILRFGLGEPYIYHDLGGFTRIGKIVEGV